MSLPANRLYICWNEVIPTQGCCNIVERFAEDNFCKVVDSKVWHEERYRGTVTCIRAVFSRRIYKVNHNILGNTYCIVPEHHEDGDDIEETYTIPRRSLKLSIGIRSFLSAVNEGAVYWIVEPDQYISKDLEWSRKCKFYDNPYQVPEVKDRYVLRIKDEPSEGLYYHLDRIISCGSLLVVITPWVPYLPVLLDDRTWIFSKINLSEGYCVSYDRFTPDRVSRAKSARK